MPRRPLSLSAASVPPSSATRLSPWLSKLSCDSHQSDQYLKYRSLTVHCKITTDVLARAVIFWLSPDGKESYVVCALTGRTRRNRKCNALSVVNMTEWDIPVALLTRCCRRYIDHFSLLSNNWCGTTWMSRAFRLQLKHLQWFARRRCCVKLWQL